MAQYKGRHQKTYTLGTRLGGGGEGDVYEVDGYPNLVAKVYKDEKFNGAPGTAGTRQYMREKIETMLDQPVKSRDGGILYVAWPEDILLDTQGKFVGYTMPRVNSKYHIYHASRERERKMLFPNYTWRTAVVIAYNLTVAVKMVHDTGAVIGDLNPNNIMLDKSGCITLIDTDSFNITNQKTGKVYKCSVGVPEMLAPELQGKDLSKDTSKFTEYTDCFALSIHIFNLLANNCHPFNCINASSYKASASSNGIVHNIVRGICPYTTGSKHDKNPAAPDMAMFPSEIQNLIDRAFQYDQTTALKQSIITQRPSADEWWGALFNLLKNTPMTTCTKDPSHVYPSHRSQCAWCEIESRKSQMQLPVITQKSSGTKTTTTTGSTPKYSTSPATTAGTSSGNSSSSSSSVYRKKILRSAWPLWLVCILFGVLTGPISAGTITPLLQDWFDFELTETIVRSVMMVIGAIVGIIISYLAADSYTTSAKGFPWLLLGLTVPIATLIAVGLIALAIGIVLGILYVAITIIGIVCACAICGGG